MDNVYALLAFQTGRIKTPGDASWMPDPREGRCPQDQFGDPIFKWVSSGLGNRIHIYKTPLNSETAITEIYVNIFYSTRHI